MPPDCVISLYAGHMSNSPHTFKIRLPSLSLANLAGMKNVLIDVLAINYLLTFANKTKAQ